jgi:hypothetical protein
MRGAGAARACFFGLLMSKDIPTKRELENREKVVKSM